MMFRFSPLCLCYMLANITDNLTSHRYKFSAIGASSTGHRRLADGDVHCAGIATYQIFLGYRSRTLTRSLTLNPNPITDPNPNPKINKKQNDIRMKLNLELYLKVDFLGTGVGL